MPEPVIVDDYDPRWPLIFEKLRAVLLDALGDLVLGVEHVGSTAVPGLAAKPIVDIDVVYRSAADLPVVVGRLAALGYVHQGDLGVSGREAFLAPPEKPRHHLYACPVDGEELRRHRSFRDYLATHPEDARAYGALKKLKALQFRDDRAAYTESKGEFVEMILRRALASRPGGRSLD